MKKLVWLLFFIPFMLAAETDERYLAGAVPVENGKVVFSKEFKIPGYSETRIYDIMLEWAQANFNTNDKRIVYASAETGEIAAAVLKEYMEFSRTALSLDRTLVTYRLTIECGEGLCRVELGGIRYEYEVSYQRQPEKYLAEEWITDKYALNKAKTKLNRVSGKFRKGTIDLADAYFQLIANAFGNQLLNQGMTQANAGAAPSAPTPPVVPSAPATPSTPNAPSAPGTPSAPGATVIPAIPLTPAASLPAADTAVPEGFIALPPDHIPAILLDMLPANRMLVTPASDTKAEGWQATWSGIGNMFGKRIASITIPAGNPDKSIGTNEVYRLSFSKTGEGAPWMIIECRQQGETAGAQTTTIMGEILHVWIK